MQSFDKTLLLVLHVGYRITLLHKNGVYARWCVTLHIRLPSYCVVQVTVSLRCRILRIEPHFSCKSSLENALAGENQTV